MEQAKEPVTKISVTKDHTATFSHDKPGKSLLNSNERPGDRYNREASESSVVELLTAAGWTEFGSHSGCTRLTRPGKDTGVSGSVDNDGGFICFTSSCGDFNAGESYSPFAVYAILEHHGDYGAAATALADKYGLSPKGDNVNQATSQLWTSEDPLVDESPQVVPDEYPRCVIINMEDVVRKPVEWLWDEKIALGKITVVGGEPGLGKSLISLDLAARVSTGAAFPDAQFSQSFDPVEKRQPSKVIILSAEDDTDDSIGPRLDIHGADSKNVRIITAANVVTKDKKVVERGITLADIATLEWAIKTIGGVKLIIIDPIGSYVGDADSHNEAEVRGLLTPLAKLARTHHVAIVLVAHLNKAGNRGGSPMDRFMGSKAWVGAARAAYLVTARPGDPLRYFIPAKNNYADDKVGLTYRVNKISKSLGQVEWMGTTTETAHELLNDRGESVTKKDGAKEFLLERLSDGPRAAKQLESLASIQGYSTATIRRAKDLIGVKSYREGGSGGKWMWSLPGCGDKPVAVDTTSADEQWLQ